MAKTVNTAFNEFNTDSVNLMKERTEQAGSSRDWLLKQLASLPEKENDFPVLWSSYDIKFGSFARNTKIRPLDDIDLMLGLKGDGASYNMINYGTKYTIHTNNESSNLYKYRNDVDGSINSIKIVNKLVSSLNNISHYEKAVIHRRQEAATLKLTSYEWNFDIVPAFYTDTGYYLIPDGQGDWKATDPRIDQTRITETNQKYNGNVLQLVRTLKYWNKRPNMPTIPSYLFENIIINFCNSRDSLSEYIDYNLINFWFYLKNAIYNSVSDPKGFAGNLNDLGSEQKTRISEKANEAYGKGYEAYVYESQEKNQEKAINKWREIFGDDFPKYE